MPKVIWPYEIGRDLPQRATKWELNCRPGWIKGVGVGGGGGGLYIIRKMRDKICVRQKWKKGYQKKTVLAFYFSITWAIYNHFLNGRDTNGADKLQHSLTATRHSLYGDFKDLRVRPL